MDERVYLLERCLRLEAELVEWRTGQRTLGNPTTDQIVELRRTTRFSWAEIATLVGMSREAVVKRYSRYKHMTTGAHP